MSKQQYKNNDVEIDVERLVKAATSGRHTLPRGLTPEELLAHIESQDEADEPIETKEQLTVEGQQFYETINTHKNFGEEAFYEKFGKDINDDSIVTDEMIAHASQLIPQQLTAKEDLLKVLGIEE